MWTWAFWATSTVEKLQYEAWWFKIYTDQLEVGGGIFHLGVNPKITSWWFQIPPTWENNPIWQKILNGLKPPTR